MSILFYLCIFGIIRELKHKNDRILFRLLIQFPVMNFPTGKLNPIILEKYIGNIPSFDKRVKIGPRIGEDTAVVDAGSKYLLLKSDPITFTADRIGWYSVHINANDIATMGGVPSWFLATILLPEKGATEKVIKSIFSDLRRALSELHITLCGGHTEVTPGLDRPIISGMMIGEVPKRKLVRNDRIKPGDRIILARGIAIEGTSIIAREKETVLLKSFPKKFIRDVKNFIYEPGISVIKAARIAVDASPLSGMHDPTEGGLLGGIWEMAHRQKLGFEIQEDKIYIYPECRMICDSAGIDPLRLIASGALVITSRPGSANKIVSALSSEEIPAAVIGSFTQESQGRYLIKEKKNYRIKPPFVDEITKIF